MQSNIRDRLRRIQDQKNNINNKINSESQDKKPEENKLDSFSTSHLQKLGWTECGCMALKREVCLDSFIDEKKQFPEALTILIPDFFQLTEINTTCDLLFFDLETTGLSGGAGTVAFLAAFGRICRNNKFRITQYLLLDYPGESDFLAAVLKELTFPNSVIISYNGKCFDSQIIKTRCLMNRFKPPEYKHADLLHPARRLWKNIIHDCSQKSIEAKIIGIDRGDDIPGSMAPEIWFDFLKTGNTEKLMGICDHNIFDITGLSRILKAMIIISEDPLSEDSNKEHYSYDIQRLALTWRKFVYDREKYFKNEDSEIKLMGEKILYHAADHFPIAAFIYAVDKMRNGFFDEGKKRLLNILESDFNVLTKAAALRSLAIDSERRLKKINEALNYAAGALKLSNIPENYKKDFLRRKERLERKLTSPKFSSG